MLRVAETNDVDDVVDLWTRFSGPTRNPGQHAQVLRLLDRDPGALTLAFDDESRLIGSVIVGWDGWRCHLYRLVVRPGARRAGVPTLLVAAARDRARLLNAARLDAMVHRDNADAIAFWESAGYQLHDDGHRSL